MSMQFPRYDPSLGPAKLDGEGYICNLNIKLGSIEQGTLVQRAKRRYSNSERSSLQFAADLRRLHDAGAHKSSGVKDFSVWATHIFEGLKRSNAKLLCWQGALLLVLEGHDLINLEDVKPRLGATAVRKLASVLANYGEDMLLEIWKQIELDRPNGKIIDRDVKEAMQNSGVFVMNAVKDVNGTVNGPEYEDEPDEGEDEPDSEEEADYHEVNEDYDSTVHMPPTRDDQIDIEAVTKAYDDLVDPIGKNHIGLMDLLDPDNDDFDPKQILQLYTQFLSEVADLKTTIDAIVASESEQAAA